VVDSCVRREVSAAGRRIPKGSAGRSAGHGQDVVGQGDRSEAGVPFFSLSGSDFVEMFVGVGAARVRDMFQQAEAKAPCIIFIDELMHWARRVGRVSWAATTNANRRSMRCWWKWTARLEFGCDRHGGHNRPETLDQALLRPAGSTGKCSSIARTSAAARRS